MTKDLCQKFWSGSESFLGGSFLSPQFNLDRPNLTAKIGVSLTNNGLV